MFCIFLKSFSNNKVQQKLLKHVRIRYPEKRSKVLFWYLTAVKVIPCNLARSRVSPLCGRWQLLDGWESDSDPEPRPHNINIQHGEWGIVEQSDYESRRLSSHFELAIKGINQIKLKKVTCIHWSRKLKQREDMNNSPTLKWI